MSSQQLTALISFALCLALSQASFAEDTTEVIDRVKASVVVIHAINRDGQTVGMATGFAVAPSIIATNVHVLDTGSRFKITRHNGDVLTATGIWCFDSKHDVALVQVSDPDGKGKFQPLTLAADDAVKVGKPILIVGHPENLKFTVSSGIISSTDRKLSDFKPTLPKTDVIQTDAATAHGSSGGPWLSTTGEVIGVHQAGLSAFGLPNFNFATHVKYLRELLDRERKTPLPTDHFVRSERLKTSWRILLPLDKGPNPKIWYSQITELELDGRGENVNEIRKFSIDGSWTYRDSCLQRKGGTSAAVSLGTVDAFAFEMDADYGKEGASFFLIGWNDGTGYMIRESQLRTTAHWQLFEYKKGVALYDERQKLTSSVRTNGRQTLKLTVSDRALSVIIGSERIATQVDLPNYSEGRLILGVYPTQYGPRPLKVYSARLRAVD